MKKHKKHTLSPEGREKIRQAQLKRWGKLPKAPEPSGNIVDMAKDAMTVVSDN